MQENMRTHAMIPSVTAATIGAGIAVATPATVCANVITDWDEKAIAVANTMPT